jgi:hypothetical protein
MTPPGMPLLAAGLDWLEGLLPVLFVFVWIVSQVWGVFRKAGQGGPPPRPVPPRVGPRPVLRRPNQPAGGLPEHPAGGLRDQPAGGLRDQPAGGLRGDLERQVEEFLRQAGGPPRAEPPRSSPPRSSPPRRLTDTQPPARPVVAPATRPQASRQARTAAPPRPSPIGGGITRHVEEAFGSRPRETDTRGSTDTRVARSSSGKPPAATTAKDLIEMLRDPATLANLIVVREVLDRPVDRWDDHD